MIRIIRSSIHRAYQNAATEAGRVPGLEADLADARQRLERLDARHRTDTACLEQDEVTMVELRRQLVQLRAAVADTTRRLAASAAFPNKAVHRTAQALLDNADLFGLTGTENGRVLVKALREVTAPRPVFLLFHRGVLLSAHLTQDAFTDAATRHGADTTDWHPPQSQEGALHHTWALVTHLLDCPAPWTTPDEISEVFVVLRENGLPPHSVHTNHDAAHWAAAATGTSPLNVIRKPITPTPATA
ncbi:hypothetical protein [Actinacidiphila glaucinigra]|uniref:hypothetical protein n=1 Tax=Actinacidiphila glaucinigra TaxID=235986 RepID=UPI0035DB3C6F